MSRRNRKHRQKLAKQFNMPFDRLERLRTLYGYDPVRHLETSNRFYDRARMIYLVLWFKWYLDQLEIVNIGDTVRLSANYVLHTMAA